MQFCSSTAAARTHRRSYAPVYIDRNYLVLIRTSKANFLKKAKLFKAWGNCLRALP